MAAIEIPTARLTLVLQTPDEVLALIEALPPADRAEVSPDWIIRVRATAAGDPWSLSFTALSGRAERPSAVARSKGRRTLTASWRWPMAPTRHIGGGDTPPR